MSNEAEKFRPSNTADKMPNEKQPDLPPRIGFELNRTLDQLDASTPEAAESLTRLKAQLEKHAEDFGAGSFEDALNSKLQESAEALEVKKTIAVSLTALGALCAAAGLGADTQPLIDAVQQGGFYEPARFALGAIIGAGGLAATGIGMYVRNQANKLDQALNPGA